MEHHARSEPSLPWVPWVSVPHVPGFSAIGTILDYDCPWFIPGCFALSLAHPAPCCFPMVCIPSSGSLVAGNTHSAPGPFGKPVVLTPAMCGREAVGSPKFPSYPYEYMPCPHQTPVVPFLTCHVVEKVCCLPPGEKRRLSLPRVGGLSLRTTTNHISGLNLTACTLTTPGTEHPIAGMHAGSLRTCRLNFGPVGLALVVCGAPTG